MQTGFYPPVTILSLMLFTLTFFVVMLALGGLILWMISRIENQMQRFDLLEKLALSVALSSALIPLIVFMLTPMAGFTNFTTIIVTVCSLVSMGIITFKNKEKLNVIISELKAIHPLIIITLAISFGIRLFPTLGLYVYPGDDPKFHTLYVYLIIRNKGYPTTFLPFYSDAVGYSLGLHALAAFFCYLLPYSPEQIVMLLTNIYNFLSPVSMYSLGKKLFDDKRIAVNMCFLSGVVVHTPMYFFNWGGNSFILAMFLAPIAVSIAIQMIKENKFSIVLSASLIMITVGLLYVNYLLSFVTVCGIFAVNILPMLRKNLRPFLNSLLCVFIGVLVVLPRILLTVSSTQQRESVLVGKLPSLWARTQMFQYSNFTSYSGLEKVFVQLVIKEYGGSILLIAFIGLIFYLVMNNGTNTKSHSVISVLIWSVILFLINVNGPAGFYFIDFPFWYVFIPRYIRAAIITTKQAFQKLVFLFIVVSITIESVLLFNYMVGKYADSPVTTADYKAFQWIQSNTDENATFFVTRADAGQWITPIAQRRTYPLFVSHGDFIYSQEDLDKLNQLEDLMYQNPNSEEALSLLEHFEIDYIYIGKRAIYDRQSLNPNLFLVSKSYVSVYSDGNVWIFKVIYS